MGSIGDEPAPASIKLGNPSWSRSSKDLSSVRFGVRKRIGPGDFKVKTKGIHHHHQMEIFPIARKKGMDLISRSEWVNDWKDLMF